MTLVELITYRRKGHAEHDNQSYVPAGEIDRWAAENDPIDRFVKVLRAEKVKQSELTAIDDRIKAEIDVATDVADASPMPEPVEALRGVYADPATVPPLWFREDVSSAVEKHERASGWGTYDA